MSTAIGFQLGSIGYNLLSRRITKEEEALLINVCIFYYRWYLVVNRWLLLAGATFKTGFDRTFLAFEDCKSGRKSSNNMLFY